MFYFIYLFFIPVKLLTNNGVSFVAVTVQCTRDGQFVVVVARDATLPQLSLDSVSLLGGNDAPCSPVGTTAAFAIFQFPVTACGTSMMVGSLVGL